MGMKCHAFLTEPDFPSAWCELVYPMRCPQNIPLYEATPDLSPFHTVSLLCTCQYYIAQTVLAEIYLLSA